MSQSCHHFTSQYRHHQLRHSTFAIILRHNTFGIVLGHSTVAIVLRHNTFAIIYVTVPSPSFTSQYLRHRITVRHLRHRVCLVCLLLSDTRDISWP